MGDAAALFLMIVVFFNTLVAMWLALRAMDSARDNQDKHGSDLSECMSLIRDLAALHQANGGLYDSVSKRQIQAETALNDIITHIEQTDKVVGVLVGGAMLAMDEDGNITSYKPEEGDAE